MQEVECAQKSKNDLGGMLLGKSDALLAQDVPEVAVHVVHHNEDVDHIFGDDEVKDFDRVDVFFHFSQIPHNLDLPQDSLQGIMLIIFETCSYMLDCDKVRLSSVPSSYDEAASSGADDFVDLVSFFDEVPFFAQS